MSRRLTIQVCLGLVVACGTSNGQEEPVAPSSIPRDAQQVSMRPIEGATTSVSGIADRQRLVIRKSAAWAEYWATHQSKIAPAPPAPPVDFEREMVIAAASGRKPTGGYSLSIEDAYRSEGKLIVVVLETSPGPACLVTQALTSPATAVAVERFEGSVEYVERAKTADCM